MIDAIRRAVTVHMEPADMMVSEWGRNWYWALTAVFAVSGAMFLCVALTTQNKRLPIYCHLSFLACYIMSMGYFAMAADVGWTAVEVEFVRERPASGMRPTRQVFWVRYIMWLVATPLLNTQLFLLVSAPLIIILLDAFFILVVMGTGLAGALIPSGHKWAYYIYGGVACCGLAYLISVDGLRLASAKGTQLRRAYLVCSSLLGILWCGYGVAWGLSEGGNVVSPAVEGVIYGVLDLVGTLPFGLLVIWTVCECPKAV